MTKSSSYVFKSIASTPIVSLLIQLCRYSENKCVFVRCIECEQVLQHMHSLKIILIISVPIISHAVAEDLLHPYNQCVFSALISLCIHLSHIPRPCRHLKPSVSSSSAEIIIIHHQHRHHNSHVVY